MFLEPTESLVSYDSYGDKATLKRIDVCKTSDPVFGEWAFPQISRKIAKIFFRKFSETSSECHIRFYKISRKPLKKSLIFVIKIQRFSIT